jgi:HlyD family secretion protein
VTYDAVIDVANPELKLKPGMTATVSIVADRRRDVIAVPNTALRFRPEGAASDPSSGRPGAQGGSAAGAAAAGQTAGQRRERSGGQGDAQSWRDRQAGNAGATDDGDGDDAAPVVVKRTVFVLADGKPAPRPVTTGLTDGRVTEITGGELKEGELVIVGVAGQNPQGQQRGQQRGPRIL